MKETLIANFVQKEAFKRDTKKVSEISLQVLDNFRLKEGIPDISKDEESSLSLAIAETIIDCTNFFKIPLPSKINLLYDWHDEEGSLRYNNVNAKADLSDDYPLGEVSFSPMYLKDFTAARREFKGYFFHPVSTKYGNPIIETIPQSPRYIAAHEVYHLFQAKQYPKLYANHTAAVALEKIQTGEWSNLRFDRVAQRFGNLYFTEIYKSSNPVEASQMLEFL